MWSVMFLAFKCNEIRLMYMEFSRIERYTAKWQNCVSGLGDSRREGTICRRSMPYMI